MTMPTIDEDATLLLGQCVDAHHAAIKRLVVAARQRDYVLPLVTGDDSRTADRRTQLIAAGMVVGHDGEALIRWAMEQPQ